ncbi:hypothetical protein GGR57DRAFT_16394 [Xylariaceae sp. FL1272]|nr:hypothetical protein GGR57DRAFT_16394 [Xylariaceae sp. FL1272]
MVVNLTVRVLHDGRAEKIILHVHVLHRNIHSSTTGFHASHAGFDGAHPGLHSFQPLLYALEPLTDPDKPLSEVMPDTIKLVAQAANALSHGGVLLAGGSSGNSSLVVVSGVLDSKAPLVVQLHLADSLSTPGTIDLACAGVPLLGGTVVLDTSAVADQIVTRGFAIAVVTGTKLNNAIALVLSHSLDGSEEVVEASVDALGRGCKGAGLARDHGSGRDRSGSRRRCNRGHLTRRAEGAGVAIGDNHAGGNSRVVGVLLERNFGDFQGTSGRKERMRTGLKGVGRTGASTARSVRMALGGGRRGRDGRGRGPGDTVSKTLFRRCWWWCRRVLTVLRRV